MDLDAAIAQLREELQMLNSAILALERLLASGPRRQGRPPKWLQPTKNKPTRGRSSEDKANE